MRGIIIYTGMYYICIKLYYLFRTTISDIYIHVYYKWHTISTLFCACICVCVLFYGKLPIRKDFGFNTTISPSLLLYLRILLSKSWACANFLGWVDSTRVMPMDKLPRSCLIIPLNNLSTCSSSSWVTVSCLNTLWFLRKFEFTQFGACFIHLFRISVIIMDLGYAHWLDSIGFTHALCNCLRQLLYTKSLEQRAGHSCDRSWYFCASEHIFDFCDIISPSAYFSENQSEIILKEKNVRSLLGFFWSSLIQFWSLVSYVCLGFTPSSAFSCIYLIQTNILLKIFLNLTESFDWLT